MKYRLMSSCRWYFNSHLPLDKIAAILEDDILNAFSWMKHHTIPIRISLKFVPSSPIDNKPALVEVMASPNRQQAITWTNVGPVHRCIYAALGGDELTSACQYFQWTPLAESCHVSRVISAWLSNHTSSKVWDKSTSYTAGHDYRRE